MGLTVLLMLLCSYVLSRLFFFREAQRGVFHSIPSLALSSPSPPLSPVFTTHMLGLKSTESWSASLCGCAPVTGV